MSKHSEEVLSSITRTAQAVALTFGPSCETLVHDMSRPGHPILAIFNGQVSGRRVGSTADIFGSDLGVPPAEGWENALTEDIVNAFARTASGRYIKSTTIHYKGKDYHYALGINFDYTALSGALGALTDLTSTSADLGLHIEEQQSRASAGTIEELFDRCVREVGIPVDAMNYQDRLRLIALLEKNGAFSIRRSVDYISEKLGVSRYTVYKYRHSIQA